MALDDMLGRDYIYHDGYTVSRLTVVGWDPDRGWRLTGRGYSSEWVPRAMFRRLVREGILVRA